jgi:hypothetical protein
VAVGFQRRSRAVIATGAGRQSGPSGGRPDSLVAAAAALPIGDQDAYWSLRIRDEEWQQEGWRHYDICGEYRFATNRHAAALSRCRIYVAKVDKATGKPGKEADDVSVRALGETIFGSVTAKAEGLRVLGIQLYVSGEGYIVAEGGTRGQDDSWYVVSAKELKKEAGSVKVKRPMTIGGGWKTLDPKRDILMRCWTPHPRMYDVADSPTRAVLPTLREIERLTMLTFSQIDSRLISAGVLLLRQGIDFPHKEGQTGAQGLADMLIEVAKAQLTGAGSAAGLVPIIAEMPVGPDGKGADVASSVAHLKFDTPLTAELKDKIDQAIRRLAMGLEIQPEELLGQGDANHWGSWQIEESSIKLFIEPALARVCASLTEAYLKNALKVLGKDPDDYVLWYDTSELVVRPNRQEDAVTLYGLGELNGDSLRKAGAWDDSDKPTDEQRVYWLVRKLVETDPALIADPKIAKILGLPSGIQVQQAPPALPPGQDPGAPGQDPGAEEQAAGQQNEQRRLPAAPKSQESPAQKSYAALLPGSEQVVLRALELAGGRLLDRQNRGRLGTFAKHEIHTQVRPTSIEQAKTLMSGAWAHVPTLADHYSVSPTGLQDLLSGYCAELLVRGHPHSSDLLVEVFRRAGLQHT